MQQAQTLQLACAIKKAVVMPQSLVILSVRSAVYYAHVHCCLQRSIVYLIVPTLRIHMTYQRLYKYHSQSSYSAEVDCDAYFLFKFEFGVIVEVEVC
jgi:hypothetical protein